MTRATALRRVGLAFLAALTLVSFAPVLGVILAGSLATMFDCPLDEGAAHACIAAGYDIGGLLHTLEVLGWLMFLTAPGMLVSLGAWVVLGVRRRLRRRL